MGLFDKIKSAIGFKYEVDSEFRTVFLQTIQEQLEESKYFYSIVFSKISTYTNEIKKWDSEKKEAFLIFLANTTKDTHLSHLKGNTMESNEHQMALQMLQAFFKSKMKLSKETILILFDIFKNNPKQKNYSGLYFWPISGFFKQIECNFSSNQIPDNIVNLLNEILSQKKEVNSYY